MLISILTVTETTVPTAKGSYQKLEVAYKDEAGKVSGKNVVSFANKPVYELLKNAVTGESYDITNEKIGANWNWTAARKLGAGEKPVPQAEKPAYQGGTAAPKNTYETPEERAKKQIYIVRQSSISAAIAFATEIKTVKTKEDIVELAKFFESYVLDLGDGVDNDIPE